MISDREHYQSFLKNLVGLAQICNQQLSEPTIEMYEQILGSYGWEQVNRTLTKIFEERKARDPFPSPRDIKDLMGVREVCDESKARESAARIRSAVSKFGSPNGDRAEEYIGSIGWEVVRMQGGWSQVCDGLTHNNSPTYQAQWRALALALIEKSRRPGGLSLPPNFDSQTLPPSTQKYLDVAMGKIPPKDNKEF